MTSAFREPVTQSGPNNLSASNARWLNLRPIDAWFFRDSRPYNASESNQTDVVSLFPPAVTTLVGAIRAGLARSKGWDGRSNWANDDKLSRVLGQTFDDLGTLTIRGPWLSRQSRNLTSHSGSSDLLFPMPLHVIGKTRAKTADEASQEDIVSSDDIDLLWQPHCLLTPSAKAFVCDLGAAHLPVASRVRSLTFDENKQGLKEPSGLWVTQSGLLRILEGQLPELSDIVAAERMWKHEIRVGLERCEAARTTKEGALYSPRYVRLQPGVSLVTSITGLPDDWQVPELLPLGGEGRMAECRSDQPVVFPDVLQVQRYNGDDSHQRRAIAVVLLTPLLPDDEDRESGVVAVPIPGQAFFGTNGTTVISACVGRPQTTGSWNSLERRPLDLRPMFPAGSTWFLEVDDMAAFARLAANGFGLKTKYGFGQVALGVWPNREIGT